MNKIEALKAAEELTRLLSTAPLKSNGYAADGWRTPTFEERVAAVLRIAAFLQTEDEV